MSYAHEALRKGRQSVAGQVYLVTFTTRDRQPHFVDWDIAAHAARLLSAPSRWQRSRLLAWVLMPDHWHGLIELGCHDDMGPCVGRVKGCSARRLRQSHAGLGAVWARAFHDRALRADEDLVAAARYLVMNPVRAGLVARLGDYPFWDAVWVGEARARA